MKRKIGVKTERYAIILLLITKFRKEFFALASPSYANFHNLLPFLGEVSAANDVFRSIFWGIISVLRWFTNGAEVGINNLIMMPNHFFSSEQMLLLINVVNIIFLALIPLSLMWVGYKIIYAGAKGIDIFKKSIKATFLSLGVMIGTTWILTTGMNLFARSTGALHELTSDFSNTLVDAKILNSLLDLEHAYHFGVSFTTESRDMLNNFESIDLDHLNFNENADRNVFTHTAIWNGGTYEFIELSSGQVGLWTIEMFVGHMYRFQVINWSTLLIQLCVVAVAFFLTGVKFAKLLFELAYKRLLTNLIAVLSFSDASKLKKLLADVGNTLLVLFLIVLFFRMYGDFVVWLGTLSVHSFVYLFLMIGASLSLLDGPVFIQKLTGIDVGISSDGMKAALITGRLISSSSNMLRRTEKAEMTVDNFGGDFFDGVANRFKTAKTDVQEHPQYEDNQTNKSNLGHDFAADKHYGYKQKPVGFDDHSIKYPPVYSNQNQNEDRSITQNDLSNSTLLDSESVMSGNPKNSYMSDYLNVKDNQNHSMTKKIYANEQHNSIREDSLTFNYNQHHANFMKQQHSHTQHTEFENVKEEATKFTVAALNGRTATDLIFSTKVPLTSEVQNLTNTSNNFNYTNMNQYQSSFSEQPINNQQKLADGLDGKTLESSADIDCSQLEQDDIGSKNEKGESYVSDTKGNTKCNKIRS